MVGWKNTEQWRTKMPSRETLIQQVRNTLGKKDKEGLPTACCTKCGFRIAGPNHEKGNHHQIGREGHFAVKKR